MSDQPPMPVQPSSQTPNSAATPKSPAPGSEAKTQGEKNFRQNWPDWAKQLPRVKFTAEPDPNFQLIDRAEMRQLLKDADPEAVRRLEEDMEFIDHELMRLFRQRDFEAAREQNRYRLYQLGFMALATVATVIGSFQALALNSITNLVPYLAFAETVVALLTTYLASISGREPPLPLWLQSRRRAEQMRREYFRFLMNIPPYDEVDGYERRVLLSKRAADINRGVASDN